MRAISRCKIIPLHGLLTKQNSSLFLAFYHPHRFLVTELLLGDGRNDSFSQMDSRRIHDPKNRPVSKWLGKLLGLLRTGSAVLMLVSGLRALPLAAQETAFSYQGRLLENGQPSNGSYDFTFAVFDAPATGNQIGSAVTLGPIEVTNGLFLTTLDFGAGVFSGPQRWLQIGDRKSVV